MKISDMMLATRYVMNKLGYFAGGPCYDEDMPAYVAPIGEACYVDEPTWLVVGHCDGHWFCEDTNGKGSWDGETPQDALDEWLKQERG